MKPLDAPGADASGGGCPRLASEAGTDVAILARIQSIERQLHAISGNGSTGSSRLTPASPAADGCEWGKDIAQLREALRTTRDDLDSLSRSFEEERRERYKTLLDVGRLAEDVAEATSSVLRHAEEKFSSEAAAVCGELQKVASARHAPSEEWRRLEDIFALMSREVHKRVDGLEAVLQELRGAAGACRVPAPRAPGARAP
eukprot:CAMPEP_0175694774 /NCGR_PEP_ID=MMETSP0097-20121207/32102_1 /TAXON_ID=311494 /ORGANISM="Alexandrium monilatum, Strain CCMP3105" /LENGTH=200 /DNA_ID=CAMNT_0017001897 /DNA_START=53 /DNA_END=652 /DNA_ORIENTATION=+